MGWEIHQYDVVAAYLLTTPRKIMYAHYPPGFREFCASSAASAHPFIQCALLR
jgi:hypothetical protein